MSDIKRVCDCTRCGLPSEFPGTQIDLTGQCRLCRETKQDSWPSLGEEALRDLIIERAGSARWACLVAFSGGKDSTYMLRRLAEWFPQRVLAFTFDTQVMSEETWNNIDRVVGKLGVEWVKHVPRAGYMNTLFQKVFPKLVELRQKTLYSRGVLEFGPICWPCGTLYNLQTIRAALEREIPTVLVGFNPAQDSTHYPHAHGQLKTPGDLHQARQTPREDGISAKDYVTMTSPIRRLIRAELGEVNAAEYCDFTIDTNFKKMRVLRFYDYVNYDETAIRKSAAEVGFVAPPDCGYGSTNCTLNPLVRHVYQALYGVDKYRAQDAALVRWGLGSRSKTSDWASQVPDRASVLPLVEKIQIGAAQFDAILSEKPAETSLK